MKKEQLWTKNFILVSTINFFVTLMFFLLIVIIGPYATTTFHASTSVALVFGFSYSGVMSFLSFYAEEIDLVAASSFYFLVYACVVSISRPFSGRFFDQYGANLVSYPCFILFALGMLLFSQASTSWMLLGAAVLIGLGYGNFNSIAQAIAIKVTEPHRFGLATSTFFIFFDLGLGIGPFVLGFVVPFIGYRLVFLAMVGLIVLCIPLYYWMHGRHEHQLLKTIKTT